jgi:hypothetical protein
MGILSYFLLFAMFMNWLSGDCYLYIIQTGDTKCTIIGAVVVVIIW